MSTPSAPTPQFRTIGISPKAIGAAVAGYVAPVVVGYLANQLGANVEASTATAFLAPLVSAAVTFVVAFLARSGLVVADVDHPDPSDGLDLGQTGRPDPPQ